MTDQDYAALVRQLIQHEGERLKPYDDGTGKQTIGIGRNLTDNGISRDESRSLLDHDIQTSVTELTAGLSWFVTLDVIRQRVLIDMHINLGISRLMGFKKFLSAVGRQNYAVAASEMRQSLWAQQVGSRAVTLSEMMASGEPPVYATSQT